MSNVTGVSDPAGELAQGAEVATASGSVSPDGRVALVHVQYPVVDEASVSDLDDLKDFRVAAQEGSPLHIEMGGELFFTFAEAETGFGEMVGLVAAVIILLLACGSIIAMGLPIGMAIFGLTVGISSMALINYVIDIPSWAPAMATMIGLGVGIDYALFLLTRHREFLSRGMTVEEAVGRAVATAGQTVIFAGCTVVIAILGLAVAGVPALTAAGIATSVIVAIMATASVTLLPAFLGLAGHRINRRAVGRVLPADGPTVSVRWKRWGEHVSRDAWPYVVGMSVLLLAVAAPGLALRMATPDAGTLPESSTKRRAYDLVAEGFGPGSNGPLVIAIDISQDPSVVKPLFEAITSDAGIAGAAAPQINTDAGVATLLAYPTTTPQDGATLDTINRLREDVFPAVLDRSPAKAHVGGATATLADIGDQVKDRLPFFIAAVTGR